MSRYNSLESTLWEILRVVIPMDKDWEVRSQIIHDLHRVVLAVPRLRDATVEPCGSFVSDLFLRWGDLDISIEIPNGSHISFPLRPYKLTLLKDLFEVLKEIDGWRKLKFVSNARIPFLVCDNTYANISCHISINNLGSQMKSKILFWLKEIDGRFCQMVLLVNEWAKAHGINDPKTRSFSSYCLTLLLIFHLQTCIPAIIPPLQEIYPGNMSHDLKGVRSVVERQIEETCLENINKFNRLKRRNPGSLSELFVSFMGKFSNIDSWAPTQGICLYTGRWESIASNMTWLPKHYSLLVEDPFEQPSNSARTVNDEGLARIAEAFRKTHYKLNLRNHFPVSLLPYLVQYETSQLLPSMTVNDPNVDRNNRVQRQLIGNRPRQAHPQDRAQTSKGKTLLEADERGPAKASTSQNHEKLVWRPQIKTREEVKVEKQDADEFNYPKPARVSKYKGKQIWRPAQVSKNKEKKVWRPRSDGRL